MTSVQNVAFASGDSVRSRCDVNDVFAQPLVKSRSVRISGGRKVLRLELVVWDALDRAAGNRGINLNTLCESIAAEKPDGMTMASALRNFALLYYKNSA